MKSAIIRSAGSISVETLPDPDRAPEDVVICVRRATICGSDVTILRGGMESVQYPLVPGHEWVGEVVDAGREYRHLLGQTVVSDLLEHCGGCTFCARNSPNLCNHLVEPGLTRSGAFAEFIAVRASNVIALPEQIDVDEAPLIEPLAVALYALERVPVRAGETVCVMGGGGIGQLIARSCAAAGARVGLVDPNEARRAAAHEAGHETLAPGSDLTQRWRDAGIAAPDVVFEASGDPDAFSAAVELAAKSGRIGLVGYAGLHQISFTPSLLVTKLLSVHGVLSPTGTWGAAIESVRDARITLQGLITHDFALHDIAAAFDCARTASDGAIRVAVSP